ncbi:ribonuclease E, partial [Vibrio sp. 1974]|nr:ribonuclease E [Vibrio sp. 1974]
QRRNRRSPRHLRASGQRRRRGRDRRPNPFRLRKGGVASPEMAMGKVMPRYIPKPAPKKEERVQEEAVVAIAAVPAMQGGFACPEMAMGKVIIRREQPAVAEAPVVEPKVQETVEAKAESPIVEAVAPEKAEPVAVDQAPVEPIVEVAEAPVAEATTETVVEEAPVQEPVVAETLEEAATEVAVETPVAAPEMKAEVINVVAKPRASAPMTKAPGPQELREIEVAAAPFKAERYQAKGAGSQVATNRASAAMTKPNF